MLYFAIYECFDIFDWEKEGNWKMLRIQSIVVEETSAGPNPITNLAMKYYEITDIPLALLCRLFVAWNEEHSETAFFNYLRGMDIMTMKDLLSKKRGDLINHRKNWGARSIDELIETIRRLGRSVDIKHGWELLK